MKKDNGNAKRMSIIEDLLEKPCWVVDFLPSRVPADNAGQFFAVEQWFLTEPRSLELRRRFASMLLKLNCYYNFWVCRGDEGAKKNPSPKKLSAWIMRNNCSINILLETPATPEAPSGGFALIAVPNDDTHLSVYNPTPLLLEQLRQLAGASGFFVWQSERDD